MEINMPKLGRGGHKGSPRYRDPLMHIGEVERESS